MINGENIKYWRFTVLGICIATFVLFLWALCNLPSKDMYNPHQADKRQYGSQSYTVPPPCVDAVAKSSCEHTESQVEQYTADRSALAAQWASADVTHLAYYAGLLGISLIVLTFFETYVAGREMRKQNAISLKNSEAEYRPYLRASRMYFDNGPSDESVMAMEGFECTYGQITAFVEIENFGKSPAIIQEFGPNFNVGYKGTTTLVGSMLRSPQYIPPTGKVVLTFTMHAMSSVQFPEIKLRDLLFMGNIKIFFTDDMISKNKFRSQIIRFTAKPHPTTDIFREDSQIGEYLSHGISPVYCLLFNGTTETLKDRSQRQKECYTDSLK